MNTAATVLPFLTDDEIRQIVSPLSQPAAIVRWFRQNGFDGLKVRPNGMPLITRSHFEAVTASIAMKNATTATTQEGPDVAAYLNRISRNAKSKKAA